MPNKPKSKGALAIQALLNQKAGRATPPKTKPTVVSGVTEKIEKKKGKGSGKGGARAGSGRKPLADDEKRLNVKKSWENFASEETEVVIRHTDQGTVKERKVKMSRLRVAQEALFKNVQKGDNIAIKEFNDRSGGKARQPLVGDEEEDPISIDLGVDRLLDKAYGDDTEESD